MGTMTIRNVPEELLEALKVAAKKHRRSLNQQVLLWLEEACLTKAGTLPDVEVELAEIRQLRTGGKAMTCAEIDAAKREGLD